MGFAEQVALSQQLYDAGEKTVRQIADLFAVARTTVYGHLAPRATVTPVRRSALYDAPPIVHRRARIAGPVHVAARACR